MVRARTAAAIVSVGLIGVPPVAEFATLNLCGAFVRFFVERGVDAFAELAKLFGFARRDVAERVLGRARHDGAQRVGFLPRCRTGEVTSLPVYAIL